MERERVWIVVEMVLALALALLLGKDGDAERGQRFFFSAVALSLFCALEDDAMEETAERARVEECREDARETNAPRFLDAVDIMVMVLVYEMSFR